tara:strand:- start:6287 stop:6787 length:501 start_codon:yes stop_codon:yes gene_type:complete
MGYVFNPLAIYYVYDCDAKLRAVIYEVTNTFGERHSYLFSISWDDEQKKVIRHRCDKAFYVSPFISQQSSYDFRLMVPGTRLSVVICQSEYSQPVLNASFTATQDELSDRKLAVMFFKYPLMTAKIILAIHWQAFRLWRKGVTFLRHTVAPKQALTITTSHKDNAE